MCDTLAHPYLSMLLRGLDHVHVHIVDQVGHLRHVLDDLVGLTRDVPLRKENKRTEEEITSIRYVKKKKKSQRGIISVLLAVTVMYRSDANVRGNYNSPVCELLVIGKQIPHFLPPAIAAHRPSKKGAEVAEFVI